MMKQVIERQQITQEVLSTIAKIHEYKGKQGLYKNQSPQILTQLRKVAVIQSTESSNRIEGVTAPPSRIEELVSKEATPQNRSEQEIAGYRRVLDMIHNNHFGMPFTSNTVLQLHQELYHYTTGNVGRWKTVDNEIAEVLPDGTKQIRFKPTPAYLTAETMDRLHESFAQVHAEGRMEPLLLIATYIFDFLCIHPFLDGNGRISRLLTLYLLYTAGFDVGRYISLEKLIEESKETYYESLQRSSQGWHDGKHTLLPWWEYCLGIILAAYRKLEDRVGVVSGVRGAKKQQVLHAIAQLGPTFSISELQEICPVVSVDMIRRVLRFEKESGRLQCRGRGRDAHWEKLG